MLARPGPRKRVCLLLFWKTEHMALDEIEFRLEIHANKKVQHFMEVSSSPEGPGRAQIKTFVKFVPSGSKHNFLIKHENLLKTTES